MALLVRFRVGLGFAFFVASFGHALGHDVIRGTGIPQSFQDATRSSTYRLKELDFFQRLDLVHVKSRIVDAELDELVAEINGIGRVEPREGFFDLDDASRRFDVVLQPGHFLSDGRDETGAGTEGDFNGRILREQDYTAYVVKNVARNLVDGGWSVLLIPGNLNHLPSPLQTKIFFSLHVETNPDNCTSGAWLAHGVQDHSWDFLAAYAFGYAISGALGVDPEPFFADEYRIRGSEYYAFKKVQPGSLNVVLTLGGLGCEKESHRLLDAIGRLGTNISLALDAVLRG